MADGHSFHSSILREYDIRGIVGETLHEDDAIALGQAFGSLVIEGGGRRVCVGVRRTAEFSGYGSGSGRRA